MACTYDNCPPERKFNSYNYEEMKNYIGILTNFLCKISSILTAKQINDIFLKDFKFSDNESMEFMRKYSDMKELRFRDWYFDHLRSEGNIQRLNEILITGE